MNIIDNLKEQNKILKDLIMTELEPTKIELNMAKATIKFLKEKIERKNLKIEELKQKLREANNEQNR